MDLSSLAPSDAVVALRSLERRYRSLFTDVEDEEPDELDIAVRPGADGWSALEHVVAAARAIAAADRSLSSVLNQSEPLLEATDVELAARPRPGPPTGTVHERVAELGLEAAQLADRASRVRAADWERRGVIAESGRRVTALDLLRAAVDAGVTHLHAAKRTLDEVRGQQPDAS
jgi:hypothetical protein